jgi:lipopolysaccharide/colanic/teichoic acid biosynthesis glycosyltransferase
MEQPPGGTASRFPRLPHPAWALALKRLLDVILSSAVLSMIWLLLLLVALAVRFSSPGPIFYRGVRTGLFGKPFQIFKFRTMAPDAEERGGPTTGTNDPRVTPVGRLLRRTKLDELPQFLNVFSGDMSLVGPRPEVPEYTGRYRGEELLILAMRPGITDYASIEFADLDDRVGGDDPDAYFREHILPRKNELRLRYVKNWSLAEDMKILWRTFDRVAGRIVRR